MKTRSFIKFFAAWLFACALALCASTCALAGNAPHSNSSPDPRTVSNLSMQEDANGFLRLSWSPITVSGNENVYVICEYSMDSNFPNTSRTGYYSHNAGSSSLCTVSSMNPGVNYIRLFVRAQNQTTRKYSYGPYTGVYTFTKKPTLSIREAKASTSGVSFVLFSTDATGFEIYRAKGTGKYQKIARTTHPQYTDDGLASSTQYRYKIRPYYYDTVTKKTIYGDFLYRTCTTWGGALRFKAAPSGSKSINLSWKKVKDASGYRIYRVSGSSSTNTTYYDKYSSNIFQNWDLLATVKAGKTSYTDKKVSAGESYTYLLEAYKNVKSGSKTKTIYIREEDSATLGFGSLSLTTQKRTADGKRTIYWKKAVGASGYRIVQTSGGVETVIASLGASATSYTFTPKSTQQVYSIYAYKKGTPEVRSSSYSISIPGNNGYFPEVTGVKVSAAENGTAVKISWKSVKGASYYEVRRSRQYAAYDEDVKKYTSVTGTTIYATLPNGQRAVHIPSDTLSVVDTVITDSAGTTINSGPQQGVYYYYYVIAYTPAAGKDNASSFYSKPAGIILNAKKPAAPKSVSAKAASKKATVSWKKVKGASEYAVYFSTKKSSGYQLFGRTKKTKLTVTGLTSKKKYYFKVKAIVQNAVQADLLSSFSKESKAVTVK